ncbi:hypothetical protein [Allocoleopsis sp.]
MERPLALTVVGTIPLSKIPNRMTEVLVRSLGHFLLKETER